MTKKPHVYRDYDANPDAGFPSFFDPEDATGADLWFQPDGTFGGTAELPPRALGPRRAVLFDPAEWARAQADLSGELAALCYLFGTLDARLALTGGGIGQRLALREAAEMSWWVSTHTGQTRVSEERLTLWLGLRADGGADDSLALQEAAWAARRLMAPPGFGSPDRIGVVEIQRFLGDGGTQDDSGNGRTAQGKPFQVSDAVQDLADLMAAAQYLHPVTQSALVFHAWRSFGQGAAAQMEAAVMAACLGGQLATKTVPIWPNRAVFMPLTLGGGTGLRGSGTAVNRLTLWIQGAHQATLWALRHLDRLQDWHIRTQAVVKDLSGRTPHLLAALLADWPIVTAPMAEAQTGASRAAVQRNLDLMQQRDLIREITGQGRYRVWTANI